MTAFSRILNNQVTFLLENTLHALVCAVFLALIPYTTWLSTALIALITLRKGKNRGGMVLIPAAFAYLMQSNMSLPTNIAFINTVIIFIPCYVAACLLHLTANWRMVAAGFFLQALITVMLLQTLAPDLIMKQFFFIKSMFKSLNSDNALFTLINNSDETTQVMLANYFLGFQVMSIILSATLSLGLARSLQSRVYYPDGFRKELLEFRGEKIGLIILVTMMTLAIQGNAIAINLLPLIMMYFFLAGLSLSFSILGGKRLFRNFLLLLLPLILLPYVMLPIYIILGSFDSLFNFRMYLHKNANTPV